MKSHDLNASKSYFRPYRVLIAILMAATLLAVCYVYGYAAVERGKTLILLDFTKFYLSAQNFLEGGDIYRAVDVEEFGPLPEGLEFSRNIVHPNLNMPVVTLLFLPFLATDISTGMAIWVALSVGFIFVSAWLLGGELIAQGQMPANSRWMVSGFIALLLLIYFPVFAGAILGQLGQLLLLILCGAWIAARRGRDCVAGVLFGVALSLKPFTGIFLIVFPWLGRWRLMRWYVMSSLAISLFAAIVFGPGAYIRYMTILQEVDWFGFGWNASFMGPLSILLGGNAEAQWLNLPWLAKLISFMFSLALYLLLIHRLRQVADASARLDLAVSGSIPLMLLASPLGWIYYFPLLWITTFAIVLVVWDSGCRLFWWTSAFILLVVSGIPQDFVNSRDSGETLWTLMGTSLDTFILLAFFAFVIGAAWQFEKTVDINVKSLAGSRKTDPD